MSETIHHNNFSAADIEKYWKGLLSSAEMHAMEKAAMEDPFLADALEGYGIIGRQAETGSPENDLKELRERLRQRVEDKKTGRLVIGSWWKIAASLIVVAGGIWIFRAISNSRTERPIAAKEIAAAPKPAVVSADSMQSSAAKDSNRTTLLPSDKEQDAVATNKPVVAAHRPISNAKQSPPALSPATAQADEANAAPGRSALATQAPQPASQARNEALRKDLRDKVSGLDVKKDTIAYLQNEDVAFEKARAATPKSNFGAKDTVHEYKVTIRGYMNSPLNTFNGQVLDKLNKPVPGASIIIPGRQQTYLTDSLGNFSFKAADTALKVSVASLGYVQRYLTLRNSNQAARGPYNNNLNVSIGSNAPAANNGGYYSNQIVLQPNNAALNEVVVVGYGARKKEVVTNRPDVKIDVLDAEPVTGWDEFNDYLERNKKIPEGADDVHGSVVVRFNVDSDGTLKNFSIEKSLNQALDAEAIRLVKEGPSWHLLKGKNKKSKITVMVRF